MTEQLTGAYPNTDQDQYPHEDLELTPTVDPDTLKPDTPNTAPAIDPELAEIRKQFFRKQHQGS